ncbi:DUF4352 domain-containing protein [Lactiplantibacillus daowaiensis]|uniref:DUF4352 domain-containing protein n=1 Tax=Lactiplantibacillus daowaiensis TaxID=2559918 RepID=A0ABW1S3S1_9LACO|nr:DUF4352 domain-containing protein [Lactiplantibacillus daowaiensis]
MRKSLRTAMLVCVIVFVNGVTANAIIKPRSRLQLSKRKIAKTTVNVGNLRVQSSDELVIEGQQVRLDLNVKNTGTREVVLSGLNFQLLTQNRKYNALNVSTINRNQQTTQHKDSFFFETLYPESSLKGTIVFEIPDANQIKGRVYLKIGESVFGSKSKTVLLS